MEHELVKKLREHARKQQEYREIERRLQRKLGIWLIVATAVCILGIIALCYWYGVNPL